MNLLGKTFIIHHKHKTQCNHSKLCNFISWWEMIKTTLKLCKRLFFIKLTKNMQRKPGMKCSVYLQVRWLHNFVRTDEDTTKKFWTRIFFCKTLKLCYKNMSEFLASGPFSIWTVYMWKRTSIIIIIIIIIIWLCNTQF